MSAGGITFEAPGLGLTFDASSHTRSMVDGHPRLTARQGAETLEVTVIEKLCADTMTGMPFPIGVEVSFGGRRFEGLRRRHHDGA